MSGNDGISEFWVSLIFLEEGDFDAEMSRTASVREDPARDPCRAARELSDLALFGDIPNEFLRLL